MSLPILSLRLQYEQDVVVARQRAREVARLLGFDAQDQIRIATAVSEIARNAFTYAGGGTMQLLVEGTSPPQVLLVRISDEGKGIADVQRILNGEYHSQTGMGLGIVGARRLMDQFRIESAPGRGTTVWLKKILPANAPIVSAATVGPIAAALSAASHKEPLDELREQNQELIRTLEELRRRQDELQRLNRELEDTNRGVVALYAELDEKADHLRRADELKTRFLSNMSHEFRTPVNSILALSTLLADGSDGGLSREQEKQVNFIRKAAESLSELVNDLLDLAKVEAGKVVVRPTEFEISSLFGALRGMLRPLLVNESVHLVFEDPVDLPLMRSDEGKVSQILRNFISNALKFTEHGVVRVAARLAPTRDAVIFSVSDTGIGIPAEDQSRIFEEFAQIENPLQRRVKGTGLGLPLTKKLAELLGGCVSVESTLGVGSTFAATIPLIYLPALAELADEVAWNPDPSRSPVLVVEDDVETLMIYERMLSQSEFQPIPARTVRDAKTLLTRLRPAAIVLDILLPGEGAWSFLAQLKGDDATRNIPVLVITAIDEHRKAMALGADTYCPKPVERAWLLENLQRLIRRGPVTQTLLIDDDEISRYLFRQLFSEPEHAVMEASSGLEGLQLARAQRPDLIVLDLAMPGMSGFEVLELLKADPATRDIPVVVMTSKVLGADARSQLEAKAAAIVSKEVTSRETALQTIRHMLKEGAAAPVH